MGFADPLVCPDCRARLEGRSVCATCGFDLRTPEAGRLWERLLEADTALAEARRAGTRAARRPVADTAASDVPSPDLPAPSDPAPSDPTPSGPADRESTSGPREDTDARPAPDATPTPTPGITSSLPSLGAVAQDPPPRRRVSAGTVLLALGALALLVAGAIFITVYWGPMGIVGRALVLLVVTAVVAAVAEAVTRRGLRASAEALWTVFLGLFSLDWFQARAQGLAGLDGLPDTPYVLVWAAIVVALGIVVVRRGRRHLDGGVELRCVSVIAGLAGWLAGATVGGELGRAGVTMFWASLACLGVMAVVVVALRRGTATTGAWVVTAGAAIVALFGVAAAVQEAVENPTWRELGLQGHGVPLAITVAVAAVAASRGVLSATAATTAAAAAIMGATALVALPVEAARGAAGLYTVLAVVTAVVAWSGGPGPWGRGGRATSIVGTFTILPGVLPWAGVMALALAAALQTPGGSPLGHRLAVDEVAGAEPDWLVGVLGVALVVVVLAACRWRLLADVRPHLPGVATVVALLTAWSLVAATDPPAVVLALAVALGAAPLWWVTHDPERGGTTSSWWWASAVLPGVAPVLAIDSWWACVVVWPVCGAGLLLLAARRTPDPLARPAACFAGTAWTAAATGALVQATGASGATLVAVLASAGLGAVVLTVLLVRDDDGRLGGEPAGAVVVLVALALADSRVSTTFAACVWLGAAAVVALLSYAPRGRRAVHPGVSAAAAVVAVALTVDDWRAACVLWPLAAGIVAAAARPSRPRTVREVVAGVATVLVGLVVVPPAHLADLGPGVTGLLVTVVAGVALLVSTRARGVPGRVGIEVGSALLLAFGAASTVVDEGTATLWTAVALLVAAATIVSASLLVDDRAVLRAAGGVVAVLSVVSSVDLWSTAVVVWPLAALVLVACALRDDGFPWRDLAAGAAAAVGVASVHPVLQLVHASDAVGSLVLLVAATVVLAGGSILLDDRRGRRGVEAAAAVAAVVALGWAGESTTVAWTALLFTVLGVAAVLVSFFADGRWWLRLVGSGALAVAYVLRLVASDVGVVEAYTAPFALVLLLAGLWVLLRTSPPRSSAVALGPALLLGLLPSLPQALADPVSVRGVLLGVVALGVLAVGTTLRWKAPFLAGAALVGLLLVVQLGPAAIALPRWVLIGVAGVTMLGVGMTWESRVRNGRTAARWIGAMR